LFSSCSIVDVDERDVGELEGELEGELRDVGELDGELEGESEDESPISSYCVIPSLSTYAILISSRRV
jgi:hypothetical protein